jgi:hypothetical protein
MVSRHNQPVPEPEYDSDDMSAGARLMRYYVSDEPRPNTFDGGDDSTTKTAPQPAAKIISRVHDAFIDSEATVSSARMAEGIAGGAVEDESKEMEDGDDDGDDEDENDNAIFRRDLAELRGDVLFDIVGRYSHQEILKKIAKFHPRATFGQRQLTYKIANAIKSRSIRHGTTVKAVRAELDAMRIANGVEFPSNYRPKSQGQLGEVGKQDAIPSNDDRDDNL